MNYDQRVYSEAVRLGMPSHIAKLIVAQAKHESSYKGKPYNSNVFLKNNNLNGYGWIGQKGASQGTIKPKSEWKSNTEPTYYAKYDSIEGSVAEIVAYIKRRQTKGQFPKDLLEIDTPYKYASLLKQAKYYTDSLANYANGLTRQIKTIDVKKGLAIVPVVLAATALYILLRSK